MKDILTWIQVWFFAQCNGTWEHSYGIRIDTLDNPGWSVTIDLVGTSLENKILDTNFINRTKDDWINCSMASNQFKAYGGPENLTEILYSFKALVESEGASYK